MHAVWGSTREQLTGSPGRRALAGAPPDVTVELDRGGAVAIDLPPAPQYVGLARVVTSWAATMAPALSRERVDDLRVAVSEACTNAMEAHLRAGVSEPVSIRLESDVDELCVLVHDHGGGFDPDRLPPRPPPDHPEHLAVERGWGVQLMRALVDEVDFQPGDDGTILRLVVRAPASQG